MVNKPSVRIRPILNMTSSFYHVVALWYVDIIEPSRTGIVNHRLMNTFHFLYVVKERGETGQGEIPECSFTVR